MIYFNNKRFARRTEITTAIVVGHGVNHKGDLMLKYEFESSGKAYNGENIYSISSSDYTDFVGKHFPVAYEKSNPENCGLLLTSLDFIKYNISYPDSLKWIEKKYFVK